MFIDQSLHKGSFFPLMDTDKVTSFTLNQEATFIRWGAGCPELIGTDELTDLSIYHVISTEQQSCLQNILDQAWQGQRGMLLTELGLQGKSRSKVALAFAPMYFQKKITEIQVFAQFIDSTYTGTYSDEPIYRLIAENITDLISVIDREGTIQYASPSHTKILGHTPDEFQGMSIFQYIHLDDHSKIDQALQLITPLQQQRDKIDFRIKHKEGHWKVVESKAFPIYQNGEEVEWFLTVSQEITKQKLDEQKIHYLAYNDPLTDLPNRLAFREHLEQGIEQSDQNEIAVLFLDIDRFKIVNDAIGNPKGELLLRDVGARIATLLDTKDMVARISGDEFTIVLNSYTQETVSQVAERILRLFHEPFYVEGHEFFITATIGISMFPQDGLTVDEIERNANTAMVHAKLNGGNQYQFYLPSMNRRSAERLSLENSIRRALDKEEYEVYYQPQVDLGSGRIMGLEALIRWRHPEKGLISPATFIPLAEETGLILPIGDWVLRKACSQLKSWHDAGLPRVPVSVNLSPRQFVKKDLAQSIKSILDETGLEANWLELEITESVLMQNSEQNIAVLRELRDIGIRISIDDFGTGYSSLGYLKRFPIDCLKIDQTFIRDMTKSREDAAIATAIISLAHNLNMRVIAEGIETEEQAVFLKAQRCNAMQGYLFSPPIPADQCVSLLEQERMYLSIQIED